MSRLIEIPDDGIVHVPIRMGADTIGEYRYDLSSEPTADAVKVVRCRNCKYLLHFEGDNDYCSHYPYKELYVVVEPNDFCSYGERRGM